MCLVANHIDTFACALDPVQVDEKHDFSAEPR